MADAPTIDRLQIPAAAADAPPQAQAKTPDQLRLLAAQFESMLLTQMLTQMRSSMFDDEGEEGAGFAKGPLADAMYGELSLALSRAGGFGLGDAMMAPLMRQASAAGNDVTTGIGMPAGTISMLEQAAPARAALFTGSVSSDFGWRQHPVSGGARFHKGVDIAMRTGQDVPAARAGEVAFAGVEGAYGNTVVINHGNGVSTRYAHLSELLVKAGDGVADGQVIARSGATGRVTGAHLHFEVIEDGQPLDPATSLGRLYGK
jgi:murein DD-endopeptidase MepM/ murein hydrolase activator NlpD